MLAFTAIETNDLEAARTFYDAFFAADHIKPFVRERNWPHKSIRVAYGKEESQPHFIIQERTSQAELVVGNNVAINLHCGTSGRVQRLYKKALELGATSVMAPIAINRGTYYLAEFLDPEGNKIGLYAAPKIKLEVPKLFRRGALRSRDLSSLRSGLNILREIEKFKAIEDATILDFGCGVKIAQALHQKDDPHKKYYGLDVYGEMIDFMSDALADNKKYEFATVPFQNEMYNKNGEPMTATSKLPIKNIKADIICMFSVITHMVPEDTLALLSLLTYYAKKDTRLIFTAFSHKHQKEDFIDDDPKNPLLRAFYNRDFLVDIIGKAGWKILEERDPIARAMNHSFICELDK